ncbi:HD phosphohydrolase domain-containing protein [Cavenderia fasciculata]|uniref:HD phosphohydrolase domain-containing protein n=1 Tax=Cavenderia fasciculata TaxID=261658 RepID=F4PMR9_CACFS|nr:HD phosphohydrolase domain-containing protein [Cavenderia fasciculata]EGG23663.1 HD phosphohydrolase domain-containing protein [Cavenderia fasciculata]|eukprot:XP_004361514.1 HD phosphohydrolase domain-containing protein [Cavenderia fasciculata]
MSQPNFLGDSSPSFDDQSSIDDIDGVSQEQYSFNINESADSETAFSIIKKVRTNGNAFGSVLGSNRGTLKHTPIFKPKASKVINDVVHGHMDVPNYILDFVDSVQFQRLRDLKQLGTTSFVFPCASHHRFEHSLGVSHLAGKFIDKIKSTQPELEITEDDQKFVRIAGLCHDLGHGPFSHAFESWANSTGKKFHHEEMSLKMLNYLIDDKGLDYSTDDVRFIGSLITGEPYTTGKRFMYDIVANHRNSVDVDKFDYLARDSYCLGRAIVCDFTRLMEFSRVIDDEICFCSKEVYNLYELFHTRYSLHKIVYTHKVGKAIEYMVSDALSAADPYLKISDQLDDPKEFINLTDSILQRIEYSKEPELKEARQIIRNIRTRNLYKFVDEVIIPVGSQFAKQLPPTLSQEIAKVGNDLLESDFIIHDLKLNYAFKDKDPVESTHFYTRYDDSTKVQILKEHASHLIPSQFQESRVRIFCKTKEKCENVQIAFRKVLKNYDIQPNPSFTVSPYKKKPLDKN